MADAKVIQKIIVEICGDGINLGQVECDDGNQQSGDGCSSECKIEEGYTCTSYRDKPDVCISNKSPEATLKLEGNKLIIYFSNEMLVKADSISLASTMQVTLKATGSCTLTWQLKDLFSMNTVIKKLTIEVSPKCSSQGSIKSYIVTFENPSLIPSVDDQLLEDTILTVKANRYYSISKEKSIALDLIGNTFSSASTITLLLMLGISLFQSTAIESLWSFVNMLQLLSYLPGLNIYIPSNLETFLTEYLTVKDITIPFNKLPDFPFNPLNYLEVFATNPFTEKLEAIGYESISFISNFSDEILTWITLLLLYLLLHILCKLIPESR